ncbi:MAG: ABC transporter ATP-binding protein/permease, partial [Propionibacteriaceae bacterium]|nr:ABC transporter ATP-binding protein/permease [Propionibacteriaceae bacterium]
MPLMNVINNLIYTLVAITGGVLSIGFGLPVGTVVSFLFYSKQFAQPLNAVAGMWNTIQQALAGAERVFEILDQPEETPDAPNAIVEREVAGRVVFKNVCFSYPSTSTGAGLIPSPVEESGRGIGSDHPSDKLILRDISFEVKPGETIALVGETGAGKTTLVNLLLRFYDVNTGQILIDGVPITGIVRDSLRRCFSVVLQDTCLFTGTILDNIRYSRPEAAEDEVIAAAKLAHAHEFIEKLPHGYQTPVWGSSDNLSEGQRQLLAIARAVLNDSPILILDEATSSVDTKTEKDIQRALLRLMTNHTSFLIAHRLSTIRDADRIMVIGDQRILESGNHAELMALKGRYHDMVVSQMGVIDSPPTIDEPGTL